MKLSIRLKALLLAGLIVLGVVASPARAAIIDLGFALDRSGSVGDSNYTLVKNGLDGALDQIPVMGPNQYRITVVSFAANITTVVPPTILTAATLAGVKADIVADSYSGGSTNIAGAVERLTNLVGGVGFGDTSLINISTDGVPVPSTQAAATAVRNTAVGAGWDSISAEAIGTFDLTYLQALVSPQPAVTTPDPNALPNPLVNGFVLEVASFDDYGAAIATKVQKIVNVPVPGTLILMGLSLLGLGAAQRNRRR